MADERKVSPKAPSISLKDAVSKALDILGKEGLHDLPNNVVAQDLGYKSINNGAAVSTIAALKAFGLMTVPKQGFLAVAKDVRDFKYHPDEGNKERLLLDWIKRPKVYSVLLEKYKDGLPSDRKIKWDLMEMGFTEKGTDSFLTTFKESVEFCRYFDRLTKPEATEWEGQEPNQRTEQAPSLPLTTMMAASVPVGAATLQAPSGAALLMPTLDYQAASLAAPDLGRQAESGTAHDRIPVRLSGGRRAWIEVPVPFYEEDKTIIKAQIDLIIADEH